VTKDQAAKKVKDLLTLSRNTSYTEEAATAKKAASKLVEKYELTEEDVFADKAQQQNHTGYEVINLNEILLDPELARFVNSILSVAFIFKKDL